MVQDLKDVVLTVPTELTMFLLKTTNNYTGYVRVWQNYKGEALCRTFAYRNRKGKAQECTEVMRELVTDDGAIIKNCYWSGYGGYIAVYTPTVRVNRYGYSPFDLTDFEKWYYEPKPLGMSYFKDLNVDAVLSMEKYKHCGYTGGDLMKYLKAYEKNHKVEFFGKYGIEPKPSYIKMASKDKQFVRFLIDNRYEVDIAGPEAVIYAYRHHISIRDAREIMAEKRHAMYHTKSMHSLKGSGIDRVKICDYMLKNNISAYIYDDYLAAVKGLGLDFKDTKNIFPNDFMRMHDLRTAEYASKKAKEKAEERAKFDKDFNAKCHEYLSLKDYGIEYQVVIPEHIQDLIYEGEILNHCVGRMGYDKKVIDGISIIAFVRKVQNPGEPFVTVEYKPKEHKVTQCYAKNDTKPSEDVLRYVAEWEKKVTEVLKRNAKSNYIQ